MTEQHADRFTECLGLVLKHEGGFVHRSAEADPGGATNMGITLATLEAWRGKKVTPAQVKALTKAEAAEIYKDRYWDAVKGDDLPVGVDYAVFDFGVNSGPGRAIQFLQRAIGAEATGKLDTRTMGLVAAADPAAVVRQVCGMRLDWLQTLRNWRHNANGWTCRVGEVMAAALEDIGPDSQGSAQLIVNPDSAIMPEFNPRLSEATAHYLWNDHRHRLPSSVASDEVCLLWIRGYYGDTFGEAGNDRKVYDDAAILLTPTEMFTYNANTDASVFRNRVANVEAPQGLAYVKGGHGLSRRGQPGYPYPALRQAADDDGNVTVIRDNFGPDTDSPARRFAINIHKGGQRGTSSLGCLTIPPDQWDDFITRVYAEMDKAGQSRIPVIIIASDADDLPIVTQQILHPNPSTVNAASEPMIVEPDQETGMSIVRHGLDALFDVARSVAAERGPKIAAQVVQDALEQGKSDATVGANPENLAILNDASQPRTPTEPETKPWWQSKTIIGGVGFVATTVAGGLFGLTVQPDASEAIGVAVTSFHDTALAIQHSLQAVFAALTALGIRTAKKDLR